jgi:MYXO-CTERM domain-containing protein
MSHFVATHEQALTAAGIKLVASPTELDEPVPNPDAADEPEDDDASAPSEDTDDDAKDTKPKKKTKKPVAQQPVAQAGCSAAPVSSGAQGFGLAFVIALGGVIVRRRRR